MDFIDIPCCLAARWCGGLIVNTPDVNPVAHDWNKVLVHYCDGGSFMGDNATVTLVAYNGTTRPLYFRGRRNLDAVLASLVADFGLGAATHVLVGGSSAGGLATYLHVDRVARRLPGALVAGVPDSGFFYNGSAAWAAGVEAMAALMNGTAGGRGGLVFSWGRGPARG